MSVRVERCCCLGFDPSDNDEEVCACGHAPHDGPCPDARIVELPNIPGNRCVVYADGDQSGTLWACPCGNWQVDLLSVDERAFLTPYLDPWTTDGAFQAMADRDATIEDAVWEHEAECEALQHLATQAGLVRPERCSPYVWTPGSLRADGGWCAPVSAIDPGFPL